MVRGKDAILAAARAWRPDREYLGKVIVANVYATYAMDGGIHGSKTGDIHLHIETHAGIIDIYKFGFNGQGKVPFSSYSSAHQCMAFDDITNILTIRGGTPSGIGYTVTLRKIE